MDTSVRRRRTPLTLFLLVAFMTTMLSLPAAADHPVDPVNGPLVPAETVRGNPTCGALLSDWEYEFKVDQSLGLGTHTFSDPNSEFEVTIVVTNTADGHVMSFDSNIPVEGVFVKGGPQGNLYDYSGMSVTSDSNLHAPRHGGQNRFAGISHVSFCFNEPPVAPQDLAARKTADGSSTRTVEWELEKTVDIDAHSGTAGEVAGSSIWTVTATKSESIGGYTVTGEIVVDNPNAFAVPVSISDTLDDGTVATVTCPGTGDDTGTVPGNGTLTCTYSASPTDDSAEENEAVVTSGDPSVAGTTAVAPIIWADPTTVGDDEVLLEDERFGHEETISETTTETFPEEFVCPADEGQYVDGVLEFTETNVATLTGDNTNLSDNATVTVTCELPPEEFQGETVTGAGQEWPGSSNWFEYTPTGGQDGTFNLIQGRPKNVVGTVTITHVGDTATLCFSLTPPWTLDPNKTSNVKIEPLDEEPEGSLAPGQYTYHFTESGSSFCVNVDVSDDAADYGFAIHLDAGFWH